MVSEGRVWVGASHSHRKSAISGIDWMKTLFFMLIWYTFSTILTLYNRTLLGDDLGKFPAPLLMNTFHFAMQVVLSTAITWFWPQRFQPRITMLSCSFVLLNQFGYGNGEDLHIGLKVSLMQSIGNPRPFSPNVIAPERIPFSQSLIKIWSPIWVHCDSATLSRCSAHSSSRLSSILSPAVWERRVDPVLYSELSGDSSYKSGSE